MAYNLSMKTFFEKRLFSLNEGLTGTVGVDPPTRLLSAI